jgi:hypothetical protein
VRSAAHRAHGLISARTPEHGGEMLGEQLLARVDLELSAKRTPAVGQRTRSPSLQMGKAQQLQRLAEMQRSRRSQAAARSPAPAGRHVRHRLGPASVSIRPDELVGRDMVEHHRRRRRPEPLRATVPWAPRAASSAHRACSTSWRKDGSSRLRGCFRSILNSAATRPGFDPRTPGTRSHISTASSILCVTIRIDEIGMRPSHPEIEQVGAQRLGRQHVERRERFVHQQQLGVNDKRTRQSDSLTHAARQFLRIGALVAIEADQVDGRQRAPVPFGRHDALRLQADLDVLLHGQPRGRARRSGTPSRRRRRPGHRSAGNRHLAFAGRHQPGDDAQQRVDLPQPERPSSETISLLPSVRSRCRRGRAGARRCPWDRAAAPCRRRPEATRSASGRVRRLVSIVVSLDQVEAKAAFGEA